MKYGTVASACAFASFAVLCGFVQLAFAGDDRDHFCHMFLGTQEQMSANRGESINRLTVFAGIDVRCSEKLIDFRQDVRAPHSKLRSGWQERLQANWSSAYCKPGSQYLEAVRNGWTIASTITTSDGEKFQVKAICNDAVALEKPRCGDRSCMLPATQAGT
jgi:hypothetical protein